MVAVAEMLLSSRRPAAIHISMQLNDFFIELRDVRKPAIARQREGITSIAQVLDTSQESKVPEEAEQ